MAPTPRTASLDTAETNGVEEVGAKPPSRSELLAEEPSLLQSLLAAHEELHGETPGVTRIIEIVRPDPRAQRNMDGSMGERVRFRFRIRALTEGEYDACRRAAQRPGGRRVGGIRIDDMDPVQFRSNLIDKATVEHDSTTTLASGEVIKVLGRQSLWANRQLWQQIGVLDPTGCVEEMLLAGEKNGVVEQIDQISGYGRTFSQEGEDTAKD